MEKLRKLMCIPADASREKLEETFAEIANILLLHTQITIGNNVSYTIEEIEFYYYRNEYFDGPEFYCTYPHISKACDFFFHYSGVDICFESTDYSFGGILIRSLKRKEKGAEEELIGGPMRCSTELANVCSRTGEKIALVVNGHKIKNVTPDATIRQGIKTDYSVMDGKIAPVIKYCYYIPQRENSRWIRKRKDVCELINDPSNKSTKKVIIREEKSDYYKDNPENRIANLEKMLYKDK